MKKYFDPAEISLQKLLNTFKLDKLLPWLHYTFKICFPSEKNLLNNLEQYLYYYYIFISLKIRIKH